LRDIYSFILDETLTNIGLWRLFEIAYPFITRLELDSSNEIEIPASDGMGISLTEMIYFLPHDLYLFCVVSHQDGLTVQIVEETMKGNNNNVHFQSSKKFNF
jgi:hypothetical protein